MLKTKFKLKSLAFDFKRFMVKYITFPYYYKYIMLNKYIISVMIRFNDDDG